MNDITVRRGSAGLSTRRLVFAGALSAALVIAPAVAGAASLSVRPASDTLAGCTVSRSGSSSSIACKPDIPPGGIGGAPSEGALTAKNAHLGPWGAGRHGGF